MAKLKFFYSSMGAGKSLDLLRINDNYKRMNQKCILLKPDIDTRWDENKIVSRIGVSESCTTFSTNDDLYSLILDLLNCESYKCVLVDEAQFLTNKHAWQLTDVVDVLNIPVICFGLRTDYNGNTFNGSNVLLGISDELHEIITLCHCGKRANMVLRYDSTKRSVIKESNSENNIHIGDTEYIPVCRKHWRDNDVGSAKRREYIFNG